MNKDKVLLIPKIENGIVIDHIPAGEGTKILRLISREKALQSTIITLGINYKSQRLGKKDLIKLQISELPPRFIRNLSLLCPGVTVKLIKDFSVDRKIVLETPELVEGILKCPNPNCITNHERHSSTCFHLVETEARRFKCNYCERCFAFEEFEPFLPHDFP